MRTILATEWGMSRIAAHRQAQTLAG